MSIDDPKILQEQAKKVRGFVDEVRDVPYLSMEELHYLLDKFEAFLKKIYGDNCHQIRFLRQITFLSTADKTKERVKMRIWYGGLNEIVVLSNALLKEYGDAPPEGPIEYEEPEAEEEDEEEEIPEEEYFPTEEAAEIARKIKEVEAEEALERKKAGVKEKETIPETPPDLKELEKKVDVLADILTFIVNGFTSLLKGCWKVLNRLIGHPEKLFLEWKMKIAASMEYKSTDGNEAQDAGEQT